MKCTKCGSPIIETEKYMDLGTERGKCQHGHWTTLDSALKRYLTTRIENATDYGEIDYLSNQRPYLFRPNTLTFVGASMGVGKTYAVFQEGKETRDPTIVIVPRVSLAMSLYEAYKDFASVSCWCSASQRDDRRAERTIHITTPPMLPTIIDKLDKPPKIAIDEIDFFDSLIRADILSKSSRSIKQILKEHSEEGIVALGQTAFTEEMQLFADEIGIPLEGIYATKKNPEKHTCNIEEINGDNGKSTVIEKSVDKATEILNKGKHAFIFADGRKTAHIIQQQISQYTTEPAVVFDRYTRGSEESSQIIANQELTDDKRVFISSNAVDVGISFQDQNAEVIVCTTENLAQIGSARSVMQRALRNRVPCPIHIYCYIHKSHPVLPKKYKELEKNRNQYHAQIIADRDATLIERHAIVKSFNELAAVQVHDFLEHHAPIAGIDIEDYNVTGGYDEPAGWVSELGRAYQDECEEGALKEALAYIDLETLWSDARIAKEGSLGRMSPRPFSQLGHEMLNHLARATGWNGEGCDALNSEPSTVGIYSTHHAHVDEQLPQDFFLLLENIVKEYQKEDHELPNYKTLIRQARGFTRMHTGHSIIHGKLVPSSDWDDYTYEADEALESIHNTDDRLETQILFELIKGLRDEDTQDLIPEAKAAQLIEKALKRKYKGLTLRQHMELGHVGTSCYQAATAFEANPMLHIDFATTWITNNYPAALTRHKGTYKLARKPYWETIKAMSKMQFKAQGMDWKFTKADWFDFDNTPAKEVNANRIKELIYNTILQGNLSDKDIKDALPNTEIIGRDTIAKLRRESIKEQTSTHDKSYVKANVKKHVYAKHMRSKGINGSEDKGTKTEAHREIKEKYGIDNGTLNKYWKEWGNYNK